MCYKVTFTVLRLYLKGSYAGPVAKAWASSNTSTSAKKYLNSSSCVTTYQVMYSSSITCGRTLYFPAFILGLAGVLFSKLPPPHPSSLTIACTVRWSDQWCHFRREFHAAATIWTKNANSKNQRQSKSSPGIHAGQCFSPGPLQVTVYENAFRFSGNVRVFNATRVFRLSKRTWQGFGQC